MNLYDNIWYLIKFIFVKYVHKVAYNLFNSYHSNY